MATPITYVPPRLTALLRTGQEYAPLVLRLGLGLMILPHGTQKLLGWFGGYGFTGTLQFFTETMGIPWLFGFLAIMAEFFGGLALLIGALTRLAALGVGIVMLVAAWTSHLQNGFFMNWYGNQAGEGVEFHLLALAMALALIICGGGYASLDTYLRRPPAQADGRERLITRQYGA